MRRKPDRLAGGKLKDSKERGEWAELYFMMLAAGLGMKVSKPFGDSGKYDIGVENQKRVLRVQVKSTTYAERKNEYSFNLMGMHPERQKYPPGSVDYFAILLIPVDTWYIVPFALIIATTRSLHFSPKSNRQKYGEYWEAWNLLKETGLTIQACIDEDWAEVDASTTDSSLRSE
ncbi:MAG: group I intron-associated PD-(D/E)XK endonuclease [Candidatus Sulfotelmatobacter sp.]